jgi:hypothetical protein
MEEQRSSGALPMLMAMIMLALLLGAYVSGYFLLSTKWAMLVRVNGVYMPKPDSHQRLFRNAWLATLYKPAGEVESWVRGVPVHVTGGDERKREAFVGHESVD